MVPAAPPVTRRCYRKGPTLQNGTLYVVATPIGNRDDLSPRACEVLRRVALIAAEDTRRTGRLLSHFGIDTPQTALHEHNEDSVIPRVLGTVKDGSSVALVSDAGTPLISDPGFRLVRAAHAEGITVSPIPGPSAVVAALSVAGLPTDRFCFEGYLPAKRAARKARLETLRQEPRTLVFLEAVHRVAETVTDLADVLGGTREAFLGRELTKLHEQCLRADLAGLERALELGAVPARGEFVLVVKGTGETPAAAEGVDAGRLLDELMTHLPGKQAADVVARVTGLGRNEAYRLMLERREGRGREDDR